MRTVIYSSPGCNCDLDDPDTYLTTGIHGKRMCFFHLHISIHYVQPLIPDICQEVRVLHVKTKKVGYLVGHHGRTIKGFEASSGTKIDILVANSISQETPVRTSYGTFLWWHQNTFQLCFRLGLLAIAKVWALPVRWSWTYLAFTTSPPSTGRALLTSRQGRRKSSGGKGLHKIRQELFIRGLFLRWQKFL